MRTQGVLPGILCFPPELVGGTPTPSPHCLPSPPPLLPRLWPPAPPPAVLLVAGLVPLFSLSSWPVPGGPCFSGAS